MNEVAIRTELLARLERAAEQREQTRELRKLQAAGTVPHLKTWLTHLTDAAALRSAATAELLLGRGAAAREAFAEAARASRAAIERPPSAGAIGMAELLDMMHCAVLSLDHDLTRQVALAVPDVLSGPPALRRPVLAWRAALLGEFGTPVEALIAQDDAGQHAGYPGVGRAFKALPTGNEQEFNEALREVLRAHRRKLGRSLRYQTSGLVCLPALALMLLAHRHALAVSVPDALATVVTPIKAVFSTTGGNAPELDVTVNLVPVKVLTADSPASMAGTHSLGSENPKGEGREPGREVRC